MLYLAVGFSRRRRRRLISVSIRKTSWDKLSTNFVLTMQTDVLQMGDAVQRFPILAEQGLTGLRCQPDRSSPRPPSPTLTLYNLWYHLCKYLSWSLLVDGVSSSCIKNLASREEGCVSWYPESTQTSLSWHFHSTQLSSHLFFVRTDRAEWRPIAALRVLSLVMVLTVTEITVSWDGIRYVSCQR